MDTPSNVEQQVTNNQEITTQNTEIVEVDIHTTIRHLFLTVCILLAISIIIFLIYQNGKSIYDNGI